MSNRKKSRVEAYFGVIYSIVLLAALCPSGKAVAQMTIVVDEVPAETPAEDSIHIAGNFQGWDPGSAAHALSFDSTLNIYVITLDSGLGNISFKFTRGEWAKVESDENGGYVPDRNLTTVDGDTVRLQILGWEDLTSGGGGGTGNSTAASNVSIVTDSFYLSAIDRYRRLWIYLPKGYSTSGLDYPVLYMHDGQNVFDVSTSFAGEWKVDETLNRRYDELGDEGIIVVAIDNGGAYRMEEYSPWENSTYGGGRGDDYLASLVGDVKPYIDSNYRTLSDRANTGIMGSSLGGLISTYAALKYDSVFSLIGSLSPAYWFNPELFAYLDAWTKENEAKLYQIAGTEEGQSYVSTMFEMHDSLRSAGFATEDLRTLEHSDGAHSEWYWAREFEAAYVWLFKDEVLGNDKYSNGLSAMSLYPNPTQNTLHVHLPSFAQGDVEVHISNLATGMQQNVTSTVITNGLGRFKIPLEDCCDIPGTYLLTVRQGQEIYHQKFLVIPN